MMVTVGVAIPNAKMAKIGPYYYWYLRVTWGSPILKYPYIYYIYNYTYYINIYIYAINIKQYISRCVYLCMYIKTHNIPNSVTWTTALHIHCIHQETRVPLVNPGFLAIDFWGVTCCHKTGYFGEAIWDIVCGCMWHLFFIITLWLFNIAMENGLPIKNGDFPWLC